MKITKRQLKKIIREELGKQLALPGIQRDPEMEGPLGDRRDKDFFALDHAFRTVDMILDREPGLTLDDLLARPATFKILKDAADQSIGFSGSISTVELFEKQFEAFMAMSSDARKEFIDSAHASQQAPRPPRKLVPWASIKRRKD